MLRNADGTSEIIPGDCCDRVFPNQESRFGLCRIILLQFNELVNVPDVLLFTEDGDRGQIEKIHLILGQPPPHPSLLSPHRWVHIAGVIKELNLMACVTLCCSLLQYSLMTI